MEISKKINQIIKHGEVWSKSIKITDKQKFDLCNPPYNTEKPEVNKRFNRLCDNGFVLKLKQILPGKNDVAYLPNYNMLKLADNVDYIEKLLLNTKNNNEEIQFETFLEQIFLQNFELVSDFLFEGFLISSKYLILSRDFAYNGLKVTRELNKPIIKFSFHCPNSLTCEKDSQICPIFCTWQLLFTQTIDEFSKYFSGFRRENPIKDEQLGKTLCGFKMHFSWRSDY